MHKARCNGASNLATYGQAYEKLVQVNGSVLNYSLIPIILSRLLTPIMHWILGITKKMWDLLIGEVQLVESKVATEQKLI
jgi:hypothetical protein